MAKPRIVLLWIGFLLLGSSVYSQSNRTYLSQSYSIEANKTFTLPLNQEYTAIKLSALDFKSYDIKLFVEDQDYSLTFYGHDAEIPSSFVVFNEPSRKLALLSEISFELKVELFFAPTHIIISEPELKLKTENCDKPVTISPSNWRTGLPDPVPGRNSTVVKHCIIHHSAGSNINTDYLNTVRNIYLLHTQSNGWDDIGYNFLIAPNGDIYSGRDPLGVDDEDNIQGAHFCSKNGGTMGICLMGNYHDISPTDTIKQSLIELLSWKLHKENLNALDSFRHPNSLGDFLNTIAMHRQGCATTCPGDSVALLLESIRYKTKEQLDKCTPIASTEINNSIELKVQPNPSTGSISINANTSNINSDLSYKIYNNIGQLVNKGSFSKSGYSFVNISNGIYTLEIWSNSVRLKTVKQAFIKP